MAWSCPYLEDDYCHLRDKICVPAVKGCILEGKVRLAGTRMGRRPDSSSAEETSPAEKPEGGANEEREAKR